MAFQRSHLIGDGLYQLTEFVATEQTDMLDYTVRLNENIAGVSVLFEGFAGDAGEQVFIDGEQVDNTSTHDNANIRRSLFTRILARGEPVRQIVVRTLGGARQGARVVGVFLYRAFRNAQNWVGIRVRCQACRKLMQFLISVLLSIPGSPLLLNAASLLLANQAPWLAFINALPPQVLGIFNQLPVEFVRAIRGLAGFLDGALQLLDYALTWLCQQIGCCLPQQVPRQ